MAPACYATLRCMRRRTPPAAEPSMACICPPPSGAQPCVSCLSAILSDCCMLWLTLPLHMKPFLSFNPFRVFSFHAQDWESLRNFPVIHLGLTNNLT